MRMGDINDEKCNCMMSGMDVYYRHGFSVKVWLIMETMTWSPTQS